MDKRKLKFRGGLHKNLIGSQTSSSSSLSQTKSLTEQLPRNDSVLLAGKILSTQSQNRSSDEDIFLNKPRKREGKNEESRKRKLSCLTSSKCDSDVDLGSPLAESTVLKRKRDNSDIISSKCESNNKSSSNFSITTEEDTNEISVAKCKFLEFLHESGIKINPVVPHVLYKDVIIVQKKMKELLNSKKYKKDEVITLMEKYFENEENFKNALSDMELLIDGEVSNILHSSSLIKILLQVSGLHPEIYSNLLSKLNEAVLIADSIESVPWALPLLQQFRFLDVVINSDALVNSLEQLLESCPLWFQNELIIFLPDIISDKQHQAIAEILNNILEDNAELINLILDCMTNLNLGKEFLNEYKEKTLNLLKTNVKVNAISAIVKFVLEDCTNTEIFEKTLKVLRNIDIQPLVGDKIEECYQNQLNIVNTLKMNMLLSKNIVNTTMIVIKDITKDPKPLDIILLLLIFLTTEMKRKAVETIFKQHIRSGFYRTSLLNLLYNDYKQVMQELQPTALQISSNLLKADERVFIDFSTDWLRLQFKCHKENIFKQREILERIIFLMGDCDQTVKNTLAFLYKMVLKQEDREYLTPHCNHLRILLEKMDNLNLKEVGTLNDLLQHLCTNSNSIADSLRDDLFILLQKQLSNFKPFTKCKGVLGAVMAIKHLMQKTEESDAENLFKTVLSNVRNCPRSQALFYDQLTCIILQTQNINAKFIKNLTNYIEEEFINTNMINKSSYRGTLIPKFGLNESQDCLTFENKKYGAIVPISFKLLRTCHIKLNENENLDAIDSLLGCAILMPEDFDVAENSVMDLVICCINWFREVISGFVTQKDSLLQKQVLQRLDNLINLQSELSVLFSLCDTKYQPSPCYFHQFPLSPFIVHLLDIKMEMDTTQSVQHSISIKRVCFIVKELLGIFEHDEGLRILASQINERNITLRSCKELVTESCKYFESLSDIATQITLSISLISVCQSLMKHSESYIKENKEKYAKIAFGFLCLQWPEDNHSSTQYKSAVIELLNNWINNEPLPLKTVTSILDWLPNETSKLEKPQSSLSRIPSISRNNFHFLFKKMFDGLINGIKTALQIADRDPKRIDLWYEVATNVQKLVVQICKTLTTKNNILIFLKHMPILLKSFLNLGMPILEHNLKYQTEEVTKILKMMQAKSILERLIYSVKGMLVLNNSPAAFWMGNLVNKNLEGQEILSQNLSSEESSVPNSNLTDDADVSSDILESDSSDDLLDEDSIP
ncbi:Fanconi anemia group D2 protein like protein [Melipona quadrifasciata]|uniref:Fanconi anemia group D2 protein like protein n=1 Tax=Melipona quadrifasciata TaxID=166423 RepID=A0A0M9A314_9HYME|nr:Fanconi anemia group D2 protein like protein [Melipona quadrifasciata]